MRTDRGSAGLFFCFSLFFHGLLSWRWRTFPVLARWNANGRTNGRVAGPSFELTLANGRGRTFRRSARRKKTKAPPPPPSFFFFLHQREVASEPKKITKQNGVRNVSCISRGAIVSSYFSFFIGTYFRFRYAEGPSGIKKWIGRHRKVALRVAYLRFECTERTL